MDGGPVVHTSYGALRGRSIPEGAVFRGVVYAAAPVGDARFRAPRRAATWDGVRDADRADAPLPQPPRKLPGVVTAPVLGDGWHGTDPELTLNVWTPDPSSGAGLPVLVFIHGGAFVAGTANTAMFDGSAFARDGVVCVTISYRLGAEGFLALEGGDLNVGLQDQLAALRWVQEEIAAFGGAPDAVTLAGQSAGAMCVGLLLGAPQARGLARRAISQSGGLRLTLDRDQATRVAAAVAAQLEVAPTREAFARLPYATVVDAAAAVPPAAIDFGPGGDPGGGVTTPLLPVRDDELVAEDPVAAIASTGVRELLVGTTAQEGNLYLAGVTQPDTPVAALDEARAIIGRVQSDPDAAMADLAASHTGAAPWELAADALTETLFHGPTRALAHAHASAGSTYVYDFAWRSAAIDGRLGACHCVELPAVFDTASAEGLTRPDGLLGANGYPEGLARATHAAWTRFIKGGDPGWAPFTPERGHVERIDAGWTPTRR